MSLSSVLLTVPWEPFHISRALGAFPYQQYEIFQEACLLHIQFLAVDAERVHGNRLLLRIADVLAVQVLAQALVGVTRIYHHHVRVLFVQLAHHAVHVELIFNDFYR